MLLNMADIRYTLDGLAKKTGVHLVVDTCAGRWTGYQPHRFYDDLYADVQDHSAAKRRFDLSDMLRPHNLGCRAFNAFEFAQLRGDVSSLKMSASITSNCQTSGLTTNSYSPGGATEWTMFELSGTRALLGRTLQPSDQQAGAETVVVLSHELWQRMFNLDEAVVGTVINVPKHLRE